jgi:hypothetical protein
MPVGATGAGASAEAKRSGERHMVAMSKLFETVEETYPTRDFPGPTYPQWAIIREIDFEIVVNDSGEDELRFFYSQFKRDVNVAAAGGFQQLLLDVCGNYVFDGGPSQPKAPAATLLSLNNQRLSYIIFKLARANWQFARRGPPIRIGRTGHDAEVYFDAHRVNPQGQADKGTDPNVIRDGCMVAYFIADGVKAMADSRNNYVHPFNIHVDLIFTKGGVSGHMPIIMDPDIRHPGGSSE